MKRVCNELNLHFRRCEEDAKAILTEKGVTSPSQAQLKEVMKVVEEEHAMLFV